MPQPPKEILLDIISAASIGVFEFNPKSGKLSVDETYAASLGYEQDELNDLEVWRSLIHPDHQQRTQNELDAFLASNEYSTSFVFALQRKDGSYKWVKGSFFKIDDDTIYGCDTDLSEETNAPGETEAVKEVDTPSETRLRNLFNVMEDVVFEMDYNGTYLNVAPTKPELFIRPLEDITGKTLHEVFNDEQADQFLTFVRKCIDENKSDTIVYPLQLKGRLAWFKGRATPIENNKVLYIASEITERQHAEEGLKNYAERLDEAQRIAGMGDFTWKLETDEVTWSNGMHELLGYDTSEQIDYAKVNQDIHHPEDLERITKWLTACIASGKSLHGPNEYRLIRKNAEIITVQTRLTVKYLNGKPLEIRGTCFDITDRKISEEELRKAKSESEEREFELRESQKIAKIGNWYLDIETNEITWNNELNKMYGFEPDAKAPDFQDFEKLTTPQGWEHLTTSISKSVKTGIPYELELEFVRKGKENGWMWAKGEPVRDQNKKTIGVRGVSQDITVLKETEIKLKKVLEEKDRLFQELHHRIKNNLQMVSSLMYTKSLLVKDENLNDFINETINRVNSIAKIHDRLLHLEELDKLFTKQYLEELVTNVVRSLAMDEEKYPLEMDIEDYRLDVDSVLALGLITNESISNIIKHAYDPELGGKIIISFHRKGNEYTLRIKDQGKGMDLKKESKPRSIGLLIIEQLSKQLKGTTNRQVAKGTLFELKFPV